MSSESKHPCPICGGRGRETVFVTRDRHFRIPGKWTVARCTDCGMVQIDPMMTVDQLMKLYPTDFYAFQDQSPKLRGFVGKLKQFLFPSLYVKDPKFAAPGHVLDSGCGTGWSLLNFREAGWACIGVEPSVTAARFGRETYGLDIRAGTVHTEKFPAAYFDYIRSNHSLEHDPDANETIAEYRRIICDSGKLLIGVPNIGSWPARWFGRYWWYVGAPVHTYNFTREHLTRLLVKNGFEIEKVRYAGNYGGLIGSIQIYLNRNDLSLVSTDGWLINSKLLGVVSQGVSAIINLLKQGDAIEITARPSPAQQPAES